LIYDKKALTKRQIIANKKKATKNHGFVFVAGSEKNFFNPIGKNILRLNKRLLKLQMLVLRHLSKPPKKLPYRLIFEVSLF